MENNDKYRNENDPLLAPGHLWAEVESKRKPNKPLTRIQKLGLSMLLASFIAAPIIGGIYREKRDKEDDAKGRQEYSVLLKLTDIDKDGSISEIEKKLLCSRMDQNIPSDTYSIARPYVEWNYCMSNPPAFFGDKTRTRIEKAIEMYRSDLEKK